MANIIREPYHGMFELGSLLSSPQQVFQARPAAAWVHMLFTCCRVVIWRKGFPILNPYTSVYIWWCGYILFTDATYTAFVVPLGVGFNTSDTQWNWSGYWDFIAGDNSSAHAMLTAFTWYSYTDSRLMYWYLLAACSLHMHICCILTL